MAKNPVDKYTQVDPAIKQEADKYTQTPLKKVEARAMINTDSFKGESDYDKYLTWGVDQNRARAVAQPWYDQFANSAVKLAPAIGLGILENAGYIGELFDSNQDYTNALTEFASGKRAALEENLPSYRQNPQEVFDLGDSGWWAQHGLGLVESIGEFLVTGAGVGGGFSRGAKFLSEALKANKLVTGALQGTAQLGTASILAYTEGAMSGAQIYKEVIESGGTPEDAARAASETVRLNTVLNTGLNITSVAPMFKTLNNLSDLNKLGLQRKAGEKLADWGKRLTELEGAGVPQASIRKMLLHEAGQEALEEDVNLFAESEGRITGGLKKTDEKDPFKRFLQGTFTEEGALNAILGAVGGVGQTAGMNYIPYRKDEEGKFVSNRALENIQNNEAAKSIIVDLKEDINYITTKQKELSTAIDKGNKETINKTREDLFNVGALRALRNGTSQEFAEEIKSIASIDNTQVGEDGKTEAIRQGYADSTNDNEYKEKANKKASDLTQLASEYEKLSTIFKDKFTIDQVFRSRMNVYSAQENVDSLNKANQELTNELSKLLIGFNEDFTTATNDLTILPAVEQSANLSALNQIIDSLESRKRNKTEDIILDNLKSSKVLIEKNNEVDAQSDPFLKAKLKENQGVIKMLSTNRAPLIFFNEELKLLKRDYNELIGNVSKTENEFNKLKEQVVNELQQKDTEKKINEEKQQEKADLQRTKEIKEVKKQQYKELVGSFVIKSSPDGGFDVIDDEAGVILSNHPNIELAREFAKAEDKRAIKEAIKEIEPTPIVLEIKPKIEDNSNQPKTKEVKEKEEQTTQETINSNNINENKISKANKIAYRAREGKKSEEPINDQYKILHSRSFNIGTEVVLKVAKETSFYKEGLSTAKIPIGIYFNGNLIGFVHNTSEEKPDPSIMEIREYVIKNIEVKTVITDKDLGILNINDKKYTVAEVMPEVITFVVAKDDGNIYSKVGTKYKSDKLINKSFLSGITYAIVHTPNGKEIALPLDTKRLSKEVADSIITAFRIFLNPQNLLPDDAKLLDDLFDKFDIDIRTPDGFRKYFKLFLYDYKLNDPVDIAEKNKGKDDKRWVSFHGNGIQFLKSGGAIQVGNELKPKEISKNTPSESQDGLIDELHSHIQKMYYNIDLEILQDNAPVSVPIFKFDKDENLTYDEYSKKTYKDHIASTTETNIIQFEAKEGEYSSFVSPKIYFSTNFLGKTQELNYGQPLKKPEEVTILPEKAPTPKKKSKTKRLPVNQTSGEDVTKDIIEERKNFCI